MTWEEAKDQIARTQGYTQWDMIIVEGVNVFGGLSQIEMLEEAAKLYAREVADKAWHAGQHYTLVMESPNKEEFMKQLFPEK